MALAGAGAVLLVVVIGIVLLFSGHPSSESSKPTTPPATPTTPVVQAPNNPTPPAGGNDANSLAELIQRFKNNAGANPTPAQPVAHDGGNNANQSVHFTIGKQLTQGGFSEKILISVAQNGRPVIPTQTLMVSPNPGYGTISITVPGSGPYVISAAATSTTNYGPFMGRGADRSHPNSQW